MTPAALLSYAAREMRARREASDAYSARLPAVTPRGRRHEATIRRAVDLRLMEHVLDDGRRCNVAHCYPCPPYPLARR